METEQNWYLVQLKPNGFKRAVINLSRQHISSFMPHRQVIRSGSKGPISASLPLFPGYLFVAMSGDAPKWRTVNNTMGVNKIVSFGSGIPPPVPKGLIEGLMSRCDSDNNLLPPNDLVAGERVRAIAGPFVELVATIDDVPDNKRVNVLFEIMGRVVRASLPTRDIERAEDQ